MLEGVPYFHLSHKNYLDRGFMEAGKRTRIFLELALEDPPPSTQDQICSFPS